MAAVKLMYFAWVRERVGRGEELRVLPSEVRTLADLVGWLRTLGPEYEAAFADERTVRAAVDRRHAELATPIADAEEIAFFPPVTGG